MNFATRARFHEWACSPGAGGIGELSAKLWFCGIEPGSARSVHDGAAGDFNRLADRVEAGPAGLGRYDWDGNLAHRFGLWQAKLMTAVVGRPFATHRTACRDVPLLKLNLYPVSFPGVGDHHWWDRDFPGATGIVAKPAYRAWCRAHRFPSLADLVSAHRPRIIIGSGVGFIDDFVAAFTARTGIAKWSEPTLSERALRFYHIELAEVPTSLFVIPFYGKPGGLNSDRLVEELGSRIRELTGGEL